MFWKIKRNLKNLFHPKNRKPKFKIWEKVVEMCTHNNNGTDEYNIIFSIQYHKIEGYIYNIFYTSYWSNFIRESWLRRPTKNEIKKFYT